MILLDTNVLIFMAREKDRITLKAMKAITEAGSDGLAVSSVSAWEIAMLATKNRISLPLPPREWFQECIKEFGIRDLCLDTASAARAAELPPIHNDPCDRWILATAITFGLPLVSSDGIMARYNVVPVIW